jgi:hypothetical protein
MSIFITPTNTSTGDWGGKSLTIQVNRLRWFSDPAPSLTKGHSEEFVEDYNTTMYHYPNSFLVTDPSDARVFDVKGPFCYLIIYPQWDLDALPPIAYPDGWISLQINWYLRTD